MDDTGAGAPPPALCGNNGTLINGVSGFNANGVLGVGVFAQDCGAACVNAATPLPVYYGCTSGAAGVCTAENLALAQQVTNPVALFAADNNGIIVNLPNLQNANGDVSVQGTLTFGLGTQADNALPATGLAVLGTDASGDFTATYNGAATVLPALIDSGADAYGFDDPTIDVCSSGAFIGYYCPAVAPQSLFAVNSGVGANSATSTVNFAVADPNTFVAGAAAFGESRRRRRHRPASPGACRSSTAARSTSASSSGRPAPTRARSTPTERDCAQPLPASSCAIAAKPRSEAMSAAERRRHCAATGWRRPAAACWQIAAWPPRLAAISAVSPAPFCASRSAPRDSSAWTTSAWPAAAAISSGVSPAGTAPVDVRIRRQQRRQHGRDAPVQRPRAVR